MMIFSVFLTVRFVGDYCLSQKQSQLPDPRNKAAKSQFQELFDKDFAVRTISL